MSMFRNLIMQSGGGIPDVGLTQAAINYCKSYNVLREVTAYCVDDINIVPYINMWPNMIHSIVDTGYMPYLTGNGSVYIDTTIYPKSENFTFIEIIVNTYGLSGGIFDSTLNTVNYQRSPRALTYGADGTYIGFAAFRQMLLLPFDHSFHKLKLENGKCQFDHLQFDITQGTDINTPYTLLLFCTSHATITASEFSISKVTTNLHTIIPFNHTNYGYIMLDIVSKRFCLKYGTGNFTYTLQNEN